MNNLICYKNMPKWNATSLPAGFKKQHNTKLGTWAKLTVFKGRIKFYRLDEAGNTLETFIFDADNQAPYIEPQAWHKVEPISEDLECQLAFYCKQEDYYVKKYQLSPTHSEVLEVTQHISSGHALDLGCGSGRNSLYLQGLGFDVTAFDKNANSITTLQSIIEKENLLNISASAADATEIELDNTYDLITSTVVLMFLEGKKVPDVIRKMQSATKPQGYNLIVSAMDSEDYPMAAHDLPFGFGFRSGELSSYYSDWNIVKYNEDVGHLHRLDENGNPIALRFTTLIAQKQ